jgi:hypothetical protein
MSILPAGFIDNELEGPGLVDNCSDSERLQTFVRTTTRQVEKFGSIAASTSLEMIEYIRQMERVLIETSEYLSSNPKNYVGSGSILHTKMRKILDL